MMTQLELNEKHRAYKLVEKQLAEVTLSMYEAPEEEKEAIREEMAELANQRSALAEEYIAGGGDPGQLEVDVA